MAEVKTSAPRPSKPSEIVRKEPRTASSMVLSTLKAAGKILALPATFAAMAGLAVTMAVAWVGLNVGAFIANKTGLIDDNKLKEVRGERMESLEEAMKWLWLKGVWNIGQDFYNDVVDPTIDPIVNDVDTYEEIQEQLPQSIAPSQIWAKNPPQPPNEKPGNSPIKGKGEELVGTKELGRGAG